MPGVLRELHIAGLGVIDDVDLRFDPGLNVLTGETGAGKTMITVGLALVLGRRAASTLVREGARAAVVGARFDGPFPPSARAWLEPSGALEPDPGDDPDDEGLVLTRALGRAGRGSVRIAGQMATVGALAELAPELVEIHGQHDAQRLLEPGAQAAFLDRFAGPAHLGTVRTYRERVAEAAALRTRLEALGELARDREREIDLLAYQVHEIDAAAPRPGELDEVEAAETRLAHAERLQERSAAAIAALADDGGASDDLRAAQAALDEAAGLDAEAGEPARRIGSLVAEAAELAHDVRVYAEGLALDPGALDGLRARIALLRDLRRKYGDDEAAVLAYRDDAAARLARLRGADDERAELEGRLGGLREEVRSLGAAVTAGRAEAGPRLAAAIAAELDDLAMPGAEVAVAFEPAPAESRSGPERVEILLAPAPGQRPLPIGAGASGGELSRVMLACRSVLADLDEVPTLVFDEIDAGIGGEAGVAVGRRLARIAATRQVLVVTHLPQIAAFADRHFSVTKREGTASVSVLDPDARVAELSRMLAGLPESANAAGHAQELLAEARSVRGADV
jgi:DNA repair protein RecN (Recombination protein N)